VPSRPEPLVVLGLVGQYPMAGVAWQAVHYLLGFQALGYDVYYVEDSGAWPYDPRLGRTTEDCTHAVRWIADVLGLFGLGERWAYVEVERGTTHGLPHARVEALYRDAAAIVNLCGATAPREEHRRGPRLLYVETDPVYEQLRIALGETSSLDFLASHDVLFTYGENLGAPDCPVPLARFAWKTTRPPVVLECWEPRTDPGAACFTSIASWENKGKDITWEGVTYQWSKHVNFLRFVTLPRRVPQCFRLAMDPGDPAVTADLEGHGWQLTALRPVSGDVAGYRDFIYGSRGEFTVAKDIYVRPRSGWFSDRSVCYLAAGKPVVTQDTGFGKYVPTGSGLFAYTSLEEAADALARIDADYAAHGTAARRLAAEHFAAGPVLRRLLHDAGVA
jgi:hypothetical protein